MEPFETHEPAECVDCGRKEKWDEWAMKWFCESCEPEKETNE